MIGRLASLVLAVLLLSCSDDAGSGIPTTNNPTLPTGLTNSLRVQGAGYSNATFRGFTADSATIAQDDDDGALLGFSGLTPTNVVFSVAINLPDRRTGSYSLGTSQSTSLSMQIGTVSYVAVDGTVEVLSWSQVIGQNVTGVFSATMTPFPGPGDPISVSAGQFTIKRSLAR